MNVDLFEEVKGVRAENRWTFGILLGPLSGTGPSLVCGEGGIRTQLKLVMSPAIPFF
jgi:hypothetical protein